jgi:hypothetical protein
VLAQRGDEAVCELAADGLLETLESRLLGSPLRLHERSDVIEDALGGSGSYFCEYGGTHESGIGNAPPPADPWRE